MESAQREMEARKVNSALQTAYNQLSMEHKRWTAQIGTPAAKGYAVEGRIVLNNGFSL